MSDIEEIYDSNEPVNESEITTTTETINTVDPLSRVPFEVEDHDTTDDVISVKINT